jgi:hypothetical protein
MVYTADTHLLLRWECQRWLLLLQALLRCLYPLLPLLHRRCLLLLPGLLLLLLLWRPGLLLLLLLLLLGLQHGLLPRCHWPLLCALHRGAEQ